MDGDIDRYDLSFFQLAHLIIKLHVNATNPPPPTQQES